MAMLVLGASSRFNSLELKQTLFAALEQGERIVSAMWQCEIIPPVKLHLCFHTDIKQCAFVM